MSLIPYRFLVRLCHPCRRCKAMPRLREDRLLDLGEEHRLEDFAAVDGKKNFADVRLAWNELGIGLQVEVRGKDKPPVADASRPRGSDGVTLWLDTRDARTSHRASRFCHQFHFLPTGGGEEQDQPAVGQTRIHRALEDAPFVPEGAVLLKVRTRAGGYLLEAFLPAAALTGYDPEQHRRLGFFYSIRDEELGEQLLSVGPEFPFWEDPSLWSTLELA